MPKVKPNRGAKKTFKVTGSGKLKRKHAFKSHLLTKKGKKRKLRLSHFTIVDKADKPRMKNLLKI